MSKTADHMLLSKSAESLVSLSILITILVLMLTGCSESDPPVIVVFRGNPVEGDLTGVLGLDDSPYLAVDTVRIPSGQELIIEPGVELRFEPGIPFEIEGKITAIGNENAPIVFTSGLEFPDRGDWDGIWMNNSDPASRFEFCKFMFGAKYGRRYKYRGSGADLDSSLWEYGSITCVGSSPTIAKSWFIAGGFHGVHCDVNSSPTIENCIFYDNAGHGVFVDETADPQIRYNIIIENDDYGVFCHMSGTAPRADLRLDYNIVWSNFSGEFNVLAPTRLGRIVQVNGNLDSCDYRFNLRLNPSFKSADEGDFLLDPCSAAIDGGPSNDLDLDGTRKELGIYTYVYRPGEIRRLLTVDKLEKAKSPYFMSCDVLLAKGAALTIEPGVEVRVEGLYRFRSPGRIISKGTAQEPIVFTSAAEEPKIGDWLGFTFDAGGDPGIEFDYTNISFAHVGLWFNSRGATVTNTEISDCDSVGVICDNFSSPTITDCVIRNNSQAGILCNYNSSPKIIRNEISYGAGYGIWAKEHSLPKVRNNLIYRIGTNGIRLDNLSNAEIINNTVVFNRYFGLYCSDNSSPDVRNNIFVKNGDEIRGGSGVFAKRTSLPTIEYNCFWDHAVSAVSISSDPTLNNTNIIDDPMFVNTSEDDYDFHLQTGSPCRTAGDPTVAVEIGAYGGVDANP